MYSAVGLDHPADVMSGHPSVTHDSVVRVSPRHRVT